MDRKLHIMFNTTKALVLREVRYKEADKILTLFSAADGKLTAKARGALRKGSKTAAATQQLTYSELTLFYNRGKYTVNEGTVIEPFSALREDIGDFSLGCYFAECLETVAVEDQPDAALLQLGLNSLYALSRRLYSPGHIKAAFELRLMALAGYCPEVGACAKCGCELSDRPLLSVDDGVILCESCAAGSLGNFAQLCPASLEAMRYILSAPAKQLFSFSLDEQALKRLSHAAEQYLLKQTERRFSTLDYWKSVR